MIQTHKKSYGRHGRQIYLESSFYLSDWRDLDILYFNKQFNTQWLTFQSAWVILITGCRPGDCSDPGGPPCTSCYSTAGLPEMLQSVITLLFSINQKLPGPGLPCPRNNHLRLFNISQTFSNLKNKKWKVRYNISIIISHSPPLSWSRMAPALSNLWGTRGWLH